jgi:hypothetical protein
MSLLARCVFLLKPPLIPAGKPLLSLVAKTPANPVQSRHSANAPIQRAAAENRWFQDRPDPPLRWNRLFAEGT